MLVEVDGSGRVILVEGGGGDTMLLQIKSRTLLRKI